MRSSVFNYDGFINKSYGKNFNTIQHQNLRFALSNVNSLQNKVAYVSNFLCAQLVDIFAITETWLLSGVASSFVSVEGYEVVRTDTVGNVSKHGVCFYVRKSLSFVSVDVDCPNVHVILLCDYSLYLVVVYRPPSYSEVENFRLIDFIHDFCGNKEVVILGDFNLPSIDWGLRVGDPPNAGCIRDARFLECFTALGLTQWVLEPTFVDSGNILDLVLTSEEDRVVELELFAPFPRCHHVVVVVDYCFQFDAVPADANRKIRRCWHRGKYGRIDERLRDFDWEFELAYLDVENMYKRFLSIVNPLIEQFVPEKRMGAPPWPVCPPADLARDRREAWNNYKVVRRVHGRGSVQAVNALSIFNAVNHEYRNFAVSSQITYEESRVADSDSKCLHAYIRNKKVGRVSVGPLTGADDFLTSDCSAMANIFVCAFSAVYRHGDNLQPLPHQVAGSVFDEVYFTEDDVFTVLSELDTSSSAGPDGLHSCFLASCAAQLTAPLYRIFRESMQSGRLPEAWSLSEVIPLFKKGSRRVALNYRPVSLTSVVCKAMERVVVKQLYGYLEREGLLSEDQFGFRRGRSVEDQLLLTYDSVSEWADSGLLVDVVLFDFSKAFDVVNHGILLEKLRCIGVGGCVLNWIAAFLSDREMYVAVDGAHSQRRRVVSGVPQGSVLGPVLFLIYVNHVPSQIIAKFKIFADDLKIYLGINARTPKDILMSVSSCQRDINILCGVAESWGLSMNVDKCVLMRYQRGYIDWGQLAPYDSYFLGDQPIRCVDSHMDLGVRVDVGLRFHGHIRCIAGKAGGLVSSILKSTLCRSAVFMMSIYKAHIRPLLEFSSAVWNTGYVGDVKLLERVQRRWTRAVDGLGGMSYADRLSVLDLYSVKGRLLRADLMKVWKMFNGLSAVSPGEIFQMAEQRGLRGHPLKLAHRFAELDARKRFFSFRVVPHWNSLPAEVVLLTSVEAFKAALHRHLGDALYEYYD